MMYHIKIIKKLEQQQLKLKEKEIIQERFQKHLKLIQKEHH